MTSLRAVAAVVTGGLTAILLSYLGAIVLLVARFGIPLGYDGPGPGLGDYLGLFAIAGGAAVIGAHIAAGIARLRRRPVIFVQAALLACGALWGFTSPESDWPSWWAPALAVVAATGTWAGGTILGPRERRARSLS